MDFGGDGASVVVSGRLILWLQEAVIGQTMYVKRNVEAMKSIASLRSVSIVCLHDENWVFRMKRLLIS